MSRVGKSRQAVRIRVNKPAYRLAKTGISPTAFQQVAAEAPPAGHGVYNGEQQFRIGMAKLRIPSGKAVKAHLLEEATRTLTVGAKTVHGMSAMGHINSRADMVRRLRDYHVKEKGWELFRERVYAVLAELMTVPGVDVGVSQDFLSKLYGLQETVRNWDPTSLDQEFKLRIRKLYDASMVTQNELSTFVEEQVADLNKNLIGTLDRLVRTGPAGSEVAVNAVKTFINTTNAAFENVTKTAKKVSAELAEATVAPSNAAASSSKDNALTRALARGELWKQRTLEAALSAPDMLRPTDAEKASGLSRSRLDVLQKQGYILALQRGGVRMYPSWQFFDDGYEPRLGGILRLFVDRDPVWTYFQLTATQSLLSDKRPVDLIRRRAFERLHQWALRLLNEEQGAL